MRFLVGGRDGLDEAGRAAGVAAVFAVQDLGEGEGRERMAYGEKRTLATNANRLQRKLSYTAVSKS